MILGSFLSILNEKNHPKTVTTVVTHIFKNCNKRLDWLQTVYSGSLCTVQLQRISVLSHISHKKQS